MSYYIRKIPNYQIFSNCNFVNKIIKNKYYFFYPLTFYTWQGIIAHLSRKGKYCQFRFSERSRLVSSSQ